MYIIAHSYVCIITFSIIVACTEVHVRSYTCKDDLSASGISMYIVCVFSVMSLYAYMLCMCIQMCVCMCVCAKDGFDDE